MTKRIQILKVPIDVVTMEEALKRVIEYIEDRKTHVVVTANAEMVMQAQEDAELMEILQKADLVLADGAGVVWAARHKGSPVPERVAGADLVARLLQTAPAKGYRIFFLGAAPGVAALAAEIIHAAYPGVTICGVRDGYFTSDTEQEVINEICAARPDVLLVGLGVPRQEKWIWRHKEQLKVPVCIGVGGVIDVMAGVVQRAPVWMQKAGLEWSFRLIKQPYRIVRMMALPRFVLRVLGKNN
jgi:N-acetylglucosaminyldiphosphoundecaprenol N-acetyl-beta-D-mannosaminyltransferase